MQRGAWCLLTRLWAACGYGSPAGVCGKQLSSAWSVGLLPALCSRNNTRDTLSEKLFDKLRLGRPVCLFSIRVRAWWSFQGSRFDTSGGARGPNTEHKLLLLESQRSQILIEGADRGQTEIAQPSSAGRSYRYFSTPVPGTSLQVLYSAQVPVQVRRTGTNCTRTGTCVSGCSVNGS